MYLETSARHRCQFERAPISKLQFGFKAPTLTIIEVMSFVCYNLLLLKLAYSATLARIR